MKIRSHVLPEFLLVILLFLTSPLLGEMEVYFSPETDILHLFRQQINLTKTSLYAAISSIDSGELVQALLEAKDRGVRVQLVLDEEYTLADPAQAKFLVGRGLDIRLLGGEAGGHMNNNFAIFDGRELLTGSYNWTERSQRFNLESVLLAKEPAVVAAYIQEFERLIGQSVEVTGPSPTETKRVLPPLPKELAGKEFLSISFHEMERMFGRESQLGSAEKKRAWEDYQGKYVRWQGVVVHKGAARMDWNKVGIRHGQGKEADVEVSFNWNNMEDILTLREGDSITYMARLSQRRGRGAPYRLDDGELLK